MRKPKFEMFTGNDGKFYFRLHSPTGQTLLSSHGFQHKVDVIQGISNVMRYGAYPARFSRRETADGLYFFHLQTPGGRVVGWSKMYHSKEGRDNAIAAVRRAVQVGKVLDLN
jgi:uncharacterized protein YegP (UPF0339 family)